MAVSPAGLVSVTGGKLTTYRRMAADAVDIVMDRLDRQGRSKTKRLRLLGGDGYVEPTGTERAVPPASPLRHARRRRRGAHHRRRRAWPPRWSPGCPYVAAEAVYAARHEMARSVDDVLSRRTRARLLDRAATGEAAPAVARLLAPELGWDEDETLRQVAAYRRSIAHEAISGDEPERALDAAFGA